MFKFLKDKLKGAISKFSDEVDEESEIVEKVTEEDVKEIEKSEEGKSILRKIRDSFAKKEEEPEEKPKEKKKEKKPKKEKKKETSKEEKKEEVKEEPKEEPKEEKVEEEVKEEKVEEVKEEAKEVKEEEPEEEKIEEEKEATKKQDFSEPKKPEVSKEPEKHIEELEEEEKTEEPEEKKSFFAKVKEKFTKEEPEEEVEEEKEEELEEPKEEELEKPIEELEEEEKKTIFKQVSEAITKRSISEKKFDELFWNFEIILMENNVAVEVVEKIKQDLREKLVESKVRVGKTEDIIISSLQKSIENLFDVEKIDLMKNIKEKKPYVICFVGVNGSGKTTTIAKMAQMLKDKNISSVIAAADTFRAAAIHQLEEHGKKLDVKVIKHDYGADPAAVAFDAISHAKSKKIDVVLIDTAGRQHSNTNLVDEMKKIIRVANPDLKIFVGDSLTGNDTVEQSREFDKAIGIDGVVLSKVDVDEKGGAALSISYVTGKPIIYIGVGQKYSDLKEFDEKIVIDSLGLNA